MVGLRLPGLANTRSRNSWKKKKKIQAKLRYRPRVRHTTVPKSLRAIIWDVPGILAINRPSARTVSSSHPMRVFVELPCNHDFACINLAPDIDLTWMDIKKKTSEQLQCPLELLSIQQESLGAAATASVRHYATIQAIVAVRNELILHPLTDFIGVPLQCRSIVDVKDSATGGFGHPVYETRTVLARVLCSIDLCSWPVPTRARLVMWPRPMRPNWLNGPTGSSWFAILFEPSENTHSEAKHVLTAILSEDPDLQKVVCGNEFLRIVMSWNPKRLSTHARWTPIARSGKCVDCDNEPTHVFSCGLCVGSMETHVCSTCAEHLTTLKAECRGCSAGAVATPGKASRVPTWV